MTVRFTNKNHEQEFYKQLNQMRDFTYKPQPSQNVPIWRLAMRFHYFPNRILDYTVAVQQETKIEHSKKDGDLILENVPSGEAHSLQTLCLHELWRQMLNEKVTIKQIISKNVFYESLIFSVNDYAQKIFESLKIAHTIKPAMLAHQELIKSEIARRNFEILEATWPSNWDSGVLEWLKLDLEKYNNFAIVKHNIGFGEYRVYYPEVEHIKLLTFENYELVVKQNEIHHHHSNMITHMYPVILDSDDTDSDSDAEILESESEDF